MERNSKGYRTEAPLVVFGATGLLGSQLVFIACMDKFSPHIILHGSHLPRLEGLLAEVLEAEFDDVRVSITTDTEAACREGGYIFYSRSIQSGKKTREEMLLDNAPAAMETGRALRAAVGQVERVVCVSNPSDLIGLSLLLHSGLPTSKVISLSGLDTTRYRRALRELLRIDNSDMQNVYTLGSHDMSMAVMRDTVRVKGQTLDGWISANAMPETTWDEIVNRVVNGGRMVIKQRGHTAYQSPALLGYRMLVASDEEPFVLPSSRYHNSAEFGHCFFSLPTIIDSKGCSHLPFAYTERDMESLARSYGSIRTLRDMLIEGAMIPPIKEWDESYLEETSGLFLTV